MNIIKITLILLVFVLILSILFIYYGKNSEKLIAGNWHEASWKYEKVNLAMGSSDIIQEKIKNEIYQNIIIHEAEQWNFYSDGTLLLSKTKTDKGHEKLRWSIKGRGHILELTHEDGRIEDYQIELLTEDLLIIYFNFDIQIRGIVKITFTRL